MRQTQDGFEVIVLNCEENWAIIHEDLADLEHEVTFEDTERIFVVFEDEDEACHFELVAISPL